MTVSGCAETRWERPGTDRKTTEDETFECRAIAHQQYWSLTSVPLLTPYFVTVRRNGSTRTIPVFPATQFGPPIWAPYAPSLALDPLTMRERLFEDCLMAKGYRQVSTDADKEKSGEPSPPETSAGDTPAGNGAVPAD